MVRLVPLGVSFATKLAHTGGEFTRKQGHREGTGPRHSLALMHFQYVLRLPA